ncbi:7TM diverse intracellular signaling domain-containing protein [Runella sp. MFBS21]|uniref:sensor histidine kinase n=1 Tax=Runella sp. MFBS21 TaxID=3034018 RepID=UPI0023F8728E|nr:7TM diverse intracellular signaling domain-containing protein [Runella sp. MFBS21]MDF7821664.1 7TM diverse intracellular signaling domain-containing protein [Runella sp. MFBS21]
MQNFGVRFITIIVFGICFSLIGLAQTNSVIYLDENTKKINIWGNDKIQYLEDTTQQLQLKNILLDTTLAFQSAASHSPDFGFVESLFWIKFKVCKKTNQSVSWVLHNSYPMVDELRVYLLNETSGVVTRKTLKETFPGYQRNINVHQCAFPLDLIPGQVYTVYIHFYSADAKKLQFEILETHLFYESYFDELWFWSWHLGFVICMIIVQLIFLLVTKERNFLLYVLFLTGYLLVAVVGGYGIIDSLLWEHNDWIKRYSIIIAVALSCVLGALFYAHALRLRALAPILYRLLMLDGILSIVLSFWIVIKPDLMSPNVYSCALIVIFFCLVSIACIVSYKRGNHSAIYYLFGTLAYFIGIMVILLWTLSYLSPNVFVANAMHIGSMLEMMFFTWALADDYRRTREEKVQTQEELIFTLKSQNKEISEALLRGQTLERKRVAADLHDSLGGTLSAMRWTLSSFNPEGLTPQERQVYEGLVEMTKDAHQRVRFLSHNLVPEDLEKDGLGLSLQKLVDKLNRNNRTTFYLDIGLEERLNHKTEFEFYSICLELINNVIKHANATEARIKLQRSGGYVHLEIFDNGKGINPHTTQGKGMQNIQDRISSLKGTWQIESNTRGTFVSAQVPIS